MDIDPSGERRQAASYQITRFHKISLAAMNHNSLSDVRDINSAETEACSIME